MRHPEQPRTIIRAVRWGDDEWARVCRQAAEQGLRPSSYVRAAALRVWPDPPRAPRTGRTRYSGPRSVRRRVRFHPEEFARVERLSKSLGVPPGRFIREAAIGYQLNSQADDELIYQLARIGQNLNQMTRLAHTAGLPAGNQFQRLAVRLRDVLDRLL